MYAGGGLNVQVHVPSITVFSVGHPSFELVCILSFRDSVLLSPKNTPLIFLPGWGWSGAWLDRFGEEIWWSVSQKQLSSDRLDSRPPRLTPAPGDSAASNSQGVRTSSRWTRELVFLTTSPFSFSSGLSDGLPPVRLLSSLHILLLLFFSKAPCPCARMPEKPLI